MIAASAPSRWLPVDLARGIAVLCMVQWHAVDARIGGAGEHGWGWWLSQQLGGVAIPSFLLLAGMSLSLQEKAKTETPMTMQALRRKVAKRGLRLMAVGYLANVVYAGLDGVWAPERWCSHRRAANTTRQDRLRRLHAEAVLRSRFRWVMELLHDEWRHPAGARR